MRAFLAVAAVALLVVVWLPSNRAARSREGLVGAVAPPEAEIVPAAEGASSEGEAKGRGDEEGKGEGEERSYRLTVVSRADGSPIAGATVFDGDDRPHGVTGAAGVVEFTGAARRWYASAPGFFFDFVDFDPEGNGWVALPPGARVTGRVLDALTLAPVRGARIVLWAGDPDLGGDEATTDEAGGFEATGALWQTYTLVVTADGYTPGVLEGTLAGPLTGIEVPLRAGATLEGSALGPDGAPLKTRVFLMAGRDAVPYLGADTDGRGIYRITGVPLDVEFVPWSREPRLRGEPVTFREADEVQRRDLRCPAPVTLLVTATGPPGRKIEFSSVRLESKEQSVSRERGDRDVYAFRAPPGRYLLSATAYGWPAQEREVVLESDARVELVFGGGLAVEGRVVTTDGLPVNTLVDWWVGAASGYTEVDALGRFRIDGLGPEPVSLRVDPWEHAPKSLEHVVPGGPPVVFVVEPAARITGRVVLEGGADRIDAQMWTEWRSGSADRLDPDGRFEFVVPDVGFPVLIAFRRNADAPVALSVPALSAGEVRDVGEIRLDAGRTVRGGIHGPDKAPLVGALVAVVEPWATQGTPRLTRSDEAGRFCLLRMPLNPFWVRVDAAGHPPHFFRVEADEVEFRLAAGGVARGRGRVLLKPEGPNEWADDVQIEADADAEGRFSVRLQPGTYRGWTEVAAEEFQLVPFVVREGETTQVEIKPR